MPTPQQLEENRRAFQAAQAEAEATGGMVCGTFAPDGRPRYYVVPKEQDEDELVARAFQVKNGRAMTEGERALLSLTQQRLGSLTQAKTGRVEIPSGA